MSSQVGSRSPWHQKSFQVRLFEAGPEGRARLSSLLNYFQEAAGEHAARLGVSVTDLLPKNLTWVLSRYHIKIWRYPSWMETVELKTWPSARQDYYALRELELRSGDGELLAAATTSWMMIDRTKKRPVPLADHLPDFVEDNRRAIEDRFEPLPIMNKTDNELAFRVGVRDLDWNRHVNHVVYIEWAVESAPRPIVLDYVPVEIEVDYRGEAFFGENVLARSECLIATEEPELLHQVVKSEDGQELTRLRTMWTKLARGEEKSHV